MPFDILRRLPDEETLLNELNLTIEKQRWKHEIGQFIHDFAQVKHYLNNTYLKYTVLS